jgi:hypothetical protein
MRTQTKSAKPYLVALLCIFIGVTVNLWGCTIFGSSILNPPAISKEQGIYGFLNIFFGLGIVVLAARYAWDEYRLTKNGSNIPEISKCPNCDASLTYLTSLEWKSWTVSQCAACETALKPNRVISGLAFVLGAGISLFIALPMMTGKVEGGHWAYGIILLVFCPAFSFWILLNCNRYELFEKM